MEQPEIPLLAPTEPVPTMLTVNGYEVVPVNDAVTDFAAVIVTVHVALLPLQAPPHPVKVWPAPAVAVSVTEVLLAYECVQSAVRVPQSIPIGLDVTVPLPVVVTSMGHFDAMEMLNPAPP